MVVQPLHISINSIREFLKLITDVDADDIDDEEKYDDGDIEVWLEEMGYEWNGQSWIAVAVED